jgi:HEAT repeat protein
LTALISLFQSLPKEEHSTIQSLLYAIASIGNDEAVEFLGKIAKTHDNYKVQQTAIQYLGNIGGKKARTILMEIMNGK